MSKQDPGLKFNIELTKKLQRYNQLLNCDKDFLMLLLNSKNGKNREQPKELMVAVICDKEFPKTNHKWEYLK